MELLAHIKIVPYKWALRVGKFKKLKRASENRFRHKIIFFYKIAGANFAVSEESTV